MVTGNVKNKKEVSQKDFQGLKTSNRSEAGLYSLGRGEGKTLPYNLNTSTP